MWHVYNLIRVGDRVMASTYRKVQRETGGGGSESEKLKLHLKLEIEDIDYDAEGTRKNGWMCGCYAEHS